MAIDPTISYFGQHPTTIILRTTDGFTGSAQTGLPTLSPGLYDFAAQSGGGTYNFHNQPIDIKNISYTGTGECKIFKVLPGGVQAQIAIIGGSGANHIDEMFDNTTISPQEYLKFTSSGAGAVAITASETACFWAT